MELLEGLGEEFGVVVEVDGPLAGNPTPVGGGDPEPPPPMVPWPDCDGTMGPSVELTMGPTDRAVKVAVVP